MLWPTELKRHSFQSSPGLLLSLRCSSVPFFSGTSSQPSLLFRPFCGCKVKYNFSIAQTIPQKKLPKISPFSAPSLSNLRHISSLPARSPLHFPPHFFSLPLAALPFRLLSPPFLATFLSFSALSCPFPPFPPLSSPFPPLFLSLSSLSSLSAPFPPFHAPFPPFPSLFASAASGIRDEIPNSPQVSSPRPRLPLSLFTLFIFINHAFFIIFASA